MVIFPQNDAPHPHGHEQQQQHALSQQHHYDLFSYERRRSYRKRESPSRFHFADRDSTKALMAKAKRVNGDYVVEISASNNKEAVIASPIPAAVIIASHSDNHAEAKLLSVMQPVDAAEVKKKDDVVDQHNDVEMQEARARDNITEGKAEAAQKKNEDQNEKAVPADDSKMEVDVITPMGEATTTKASHQVASSKAIAASIQSEDAAAGACAAELDDVHERKDTQNQNHHQPDGRDSDTDSDSDYDSDSSTPSSTGASPEQVMHNKDISVQCQRQSRKVVVVVEETLRNNNHNYDMIDNETESSLAMKKGHHCNTKKKEPQRQNPETQQQQHQTAPPSSNTKRRKKRKRNPNVRPRRLYEQQLLQKWETHLQRLVEWRRTHGTWKVTRHKDEQLYTWAWCLAHKKIARRTMAQYVKLEAVGFPVHLYDCWSEFGNVSNANVDVSHFKSASDDDDTVSSKGCHHYSPSVDDDDEPKQQQSPRHLYEQQLLQNWESHLHRLVEWRRTHGTWTVTRQKDVQLYTWAWCLAHKKIARRTMAQYVRLQAVGFPVHLYDCWSEFSNGTNANASVSNFKSAPSPDDDDVDDGDGDDAVSSKEGYSSPSSSDDDDEVGGDGDHDDDCNPSDDDNMVSSKEGHYSPSDDDDNDYDDANDDDGNTSTTILKGTTKRPRTYPSPLQQEQERIPIVLHRKHQHSNKDPILSAGRRTSNIAKTNDITSQPQEEEEQTQTQNKPSASRNRDQIPKRLYWQQLYETWERRLQSLVEWHNVHGTWQVSRSQDVQLYKWAWVLTHHNKASRRTFRQYAKLKAVRFPVHLYDCWSEFSNMKKANVAHFSVTILSSDDDDDPAPQPQEEQKKPPKTIKKRKRRPNTIPLHLHEQQVLQKWEKSLERLVEWRRMHGTWKVTRYKDLKLYKWVWWLTHKTNKIIASRRITLAQFAKLQAVGFPVHLYDCWSELFSNVTKNVNVSVSNFTTPSDNDDDGGGDDEGTTGTTLVKGTMKRLRTRPPLEQEQERTPSSSDDDAVSSKGGHHHSPFCSCCPSSDDDDDDVSSEDGHYSPSSSDDDDDYVGSTTILKGTTNRPRKRPSLLQAQEQDQTPIRMHPKPQKNRRTSNTTSTKVTDTNSIKNKKNDTNNTSTSLLAFHAHHHERLSASAYFRAWGTTYKEVSSIPAPEPIFQLHQQCASTSNTNKKSLVWTRKEFQRTTGATKGVIDKYWFSPVTQTRLRSFKDVQRFLAHLELADGDEDAAMLSMKQGGGDDAAAAVEDVNVNVNHANTPMSCSPQKNHLASKQVYAMPKRVKVIFRVGSSGGRDYYEGEEIILN